MTYCHRVERLVDLVLCKFEICSFWHEADSHLLLANPTGTQSLAITYSAIHRLTIKYSGWQGGHSVNISLSLYINPGQWEVEELAYSPESWNDYMAVATASGVAVFDEIGMILKSSFAEVWADGLLTYGWVRRSRLMDLILPSEAEAELAAQTASYYGKETHITEQGEGLQLSLFS